MIIRNSQPAIVLFQHFKGRNLDGITNDGRYKVEPCLGVFAFYVHQRDFANRHGVKSKGTICAHRCNGIAAHNSHVAGLGIGNATFESAGVVHHHQGIALILDVGKAGFRIGFSIQHHRAGAVKLQFKLSFVIGDNFDGIFDSGLIPVVVIGYHAGMGRRLVRLGHHDTACNGVTDIGHATSSFVTLGTRSQTCHKKS